MIIRMIQMICEKIFLVYRNNHNPQKIYTDLYLDMNF